MPKVGDGESNEAFQQEAISDVVPIDVVPIDVEDNVQYCKGGIEVENIPEDLGEQGNNNEDEVHNIPNSDMDLDMNYDMWILFFFLCI